MSTRKNKLTTTEEEDLKRRMREHRIHAWTFRLGLTACMAAFFGTLSYLSDDFSGGVIIVGIIWWIIFMAQTLD